MREKLSQKQSFARAFAVASKIQELIRVSISRRIYNLQILDGCPALAECDVLVPVLVKELAPRSGKTASGEQRTQIELTQCQWKLSDVVKKLVEQLGICRVHYN
jgi:hypothetical protein